MDHPSLPNATFGLAMLDDDSLIHDADMDGGAKDDQYKDRSALLDNSVLNDSLNHHEDSGVSRIEDDSFYSALNQTADFKKLIPTPMPVKEIEVIEEDLNEPDESIFVDEDFAEAEEASEAEQDDREQIEIQTQAQNEYQTALLDFTETCRVAKAGAENDQIAENVEKLEYIVTRQIEAVKKVTMPRYHADIHNYQQKLNILNESARKQPEDYTKIAFYEQKVKSMQQIKEILYQDWEDTKAEIELKLLKNPEKITKAQIEIFKKKLVIASSRLETMLPIFLKKSKIINSLENERVTVIKGKPGCGKSTQLPNFLFERNLVSKEKKMFMVTPRQMSARQVFKRVAKELQDTGVVEGKNSGSFCHLINSADPRFSSSRHPIECPLIFCTDHEFYRRFVTLGEILPEEIGYLVIDEANSRKIYTDMLISVAKSLMQKHDDLKTVFLCTSFEETKMNAYFRGITSFNGENMIEIAEKNYMTRLVYMPLNGDLEKQITDILAEIEDIICRQYKKNNSIKDANILMFMSSATEVWSMFRIFQWLNECEGLIGGRLNLVKTEEHVDPWDPKIIRKVHKPLKPVYQLFMACGTNSPVFDENLMVENNCEETIKLIFSTKVLETSLTVPCLGFVVDFGKETLYSFDYDLGAQRKYLRDISKDTAEQREGRVGRTSKGVCFRIYKEEEYEAMESSPDPELLYKNIDMIIMSLVNNSLRNINKPGQIELFETKGIEDVDDRSTGFIGVLTAMIMDYNLWTELKRSSVQKSLEFLNALSLIKENILSTGPQARFKAILKFGNDPKSGLALYQAIDMALEEKQKKEKQDEKQNQMNQEKKEEQDDASWILTEVIDVIASSCHNKTFPLELESSDNETSKILEIAQKQAQKYGDYAINLYLFQYQLHNKKVLPGFDELAYKKFLENRRVLLAKVKEMSPKFSSLSVEYQPDDSKKHACIAHCLLTGYRVDVSKFIQNELGYYHYRLEKPVRFDKLCPYGKDRSDSTQTMTSEEFVIMSDVVAKDSLFEARFSLPVTRDLLAQRCSGLLEQLDAIKLDKIPSKLYMRIDLPSVILEMLSFRMFYLEHMLGKDGYVVEINAREFKFKVAIRPDCYEVMVNKIDQLILFFRESYANFTFELGLPECSMMIGNGLMVYDIITHREGTANYFFKVPRYLDESEGSTSISLKPIRGEGMWDFLIYQSRKVFGIEGLGLQVCYDTTFSKVNYENDSLSMNLKLTCKTLKDSEKLSKILQRLIEGWVSNTEGLETNPKLIYCQKHISKELNCKPIQLKLIYSLARGTGKATLKTKNIAAFGELNDLLKCLKSSRHPDCILGPNFEYKSNNSKTGFKSVVLTNLPKNLDEISILEYLRQENDIILNARMDVEMEKENVSEPSRDNLEKEIRDVLNRVILDYTGNEGLVNQFNLYVKEGVVKNCSMMKEAQLKLSSDIVCKAINDLLNKRYYSISDNPCYRLGRQYTHIQNFDKPEFPVKKREFVKFRSLLDAMNEKIKESLESKHGQDKTMIYKQTARIEYPSDDRLKKLKDDENVKVTLYKGEDPEIGNRVEMVLRNYIKGKEIYIREEYFSFFFSLEGENYLRKLKSQTAKSCSISQVMRKSMLVVHELGDENVCIKNIEEKCKEIDQKDTKTYFMKVSHKECRDRKFIKELKNSLTLQFKDIKVSTMVSHYPMIQIECSKNDLPAARDKLKVFTRGYFSSDKDMIRPCREACILCHDSGNLRKLLFCGHVFCSGCLQNAYISQTAEFLTEKVNKLNQPLFFCPQESCLANVACCDIFAFMADKLVENLMSSIFKNLVDNNVTSNLGLVECPGCKIFNRFEASQTVETYCFGCKTHLPRPTQ